MTYDTIDGQLFLLLLFPIPTTSNFTTSDTVQQSKHLSVDNNSANKDTDMKLVDSNRRD
jgi:hypothetical protein